MRRPIHRFLLGCAAWCIAASVVTTTAHAHYLWLTTIAVEKDPQAFLFFGEDPEDQAYHLPERARNSSWG